MKLKVIILTSSRNGTAAHHFPHLIEKCNCEIAAVVFNQGKKSNFKKLLKRKVNKVQKIGLIGTLNGVRMRKWYGQDLKKYLKIDEIEKMCKRFAIPFYKVPEINCVETVSLFQELDANLGLSLGNGYINKKIFDKPKYGMINIHHEILPEYKNAQSVIWQIYNQSKTTGYTIHLINENIDKGDILYQEQIPISFEETLSGTVSKTYAMLWEKSALGLVHVLNNYESYFKNVTAQVNGDSYTTPSIGKFIRIYMNYKKLK